MKTVILEYKLSYYDDGQIGAESYWFDGELHNPNGVAWRQ